MAYTTPTFGTDVALFKSKREAKAEFEKVFGGEVAVYLLRVEDRR